MNGQRGLIAAVMQARARRSRARRLAPHPTLKPQHGGYVTVLGYEHVICRRCKGVAVWPRDSDPGEVYPMAPGHRVEVRDGRAVEVCPGPPAHT